tara:strand:+ start:2564 stop:2935 length:372 start_codon:yes stop_codon:yes gene_type:complete
MALYRDLDGSVTETSACRSWVFFNGTGTVAINTSFNISSITDAGTGKYRVNLSNSNPNTSYVCLATGTGGQSSGGTATLDTVQFMGTGANRPNTDSSYQIRAVSGTGGETDMQQVHTATWRED